MIGRRFYPLLAAMALGALPAGTMSTSEGFVVPAPKPPKKRKKFRSPPDAKSSGRYKRHRRR